MATRIKPPPDGLYEQDFYVWAERQAELLRARQFEELDLEHLIAEVADLGGGLKRSVLNNAAVVLEHLLKLQHSPATDPRNGWRATIREHRRRLRIDLARDDAAAALRDHGEHAAADALPQTCPYTLDQVTGDWLP